MATQTNTTAISTTNDTVSSNINYGSCDIDLDQQTQQQQNEIEKEIADHQPLISAKFDTNELKKEYLLEDKIYQDKVSELIKKYKYIRRTRGDGNCFYRAFGFGYFEENLNNKKELERFRQLTNDLKDKLVQLGYLDFTVEDVSEVVVEIIDNVYKNGNETNLMEILCSPSHSDYFVAYLRLFTSAYLQMNSDFFENFIEDGKTVKQFCTSEVEPMARESDNIHIIALAKAANIPLRVIYMDRSEQSSLTTHDFSATDDDNPNTFQPMITMLYRPGHYDLLYEH
jgi:ubiquitin thioesterase protein OTUB1